MSLVYCILHIPRLWFLSCRFRFHLDYWKLHDFRLILYRAVRVLEDLWSFEALARIAWSLLKHIVCIYRCWLICALGWAFLFMLALVSVTLKLARHDSCRLFLQLVEQLYRGVICACFASFVTLLTSLDRVDARMSLRKVAARSRILILVSVE